MKEQKMWNKDYARKHMLIRLKSKFGAVEIKNTNMFGHMLVKAGFNYYYYIFKKEHFLSFSSQFKDYSEKYFSGLGESINKEYLIYASKFDAKLLIAYQNHPYELYTLDRDKLRQLLPDIHHKYNSLIMLMIYCNLHNLIRTQDKQNEFKVNDYAGSTVVIHETTYSFPFQFMKKY
jgi:hypothetical protein